MGALDTGRGSAGLIRRTRAEALSSPTELRRPSLGPYGGLIFSGTYSCSPPRTLAPLARALGSQTSTGQRKHAALRPLLTPRFLPLLPPRIASSHSASTRLSGASAMPSLPASPAPLSHLPSFGSVSHSCPAHVLQGEPIPASLFAPSPSLWPPTGIQGEASSGCISHLADASSTTPLDMGDAMAETAQGLSPVVVAASVAVAAALFFAVRTAAYFQIQYIAASMLSRYVPRGGARVLDLFTGSGKNLYYLPDDTASVVAFNPSIDAGLLKTQGINAGIQVDIREASSSKTPPSLDSLLPSLRALPSSSFDAVVSVRGALGSSAPSGPIPAAAVREIGRLLKPNKPFIFIDRLLGSELDDTCLVFSEDTSELFSKLQWDVEGWLDKHIVGIGLPTRPPK